MEEFKTAVNERITVIGRQFRESFNQDGYNTVFNGYKNNIYPALAKIQSNLNTLSASELEVKPDLTYLFEADFSTMTIEELIITVESIASIIEIRVKKLVA